MENCDNEIFLSYLNYVKNRALNYVGFGVSYDDLVQIGCIALIRAIKNYNHNRNFKEYLNIYIHHYLNEEIVKVNCIHSTASVYYVDIFKILKAHKCGCVSYQEIHEMTSLSIERIKECMHFIKKDISLSDIQLDDLELCDTENLELEIIHNLDDRRIVEKFFSNTYISEREKYVLQLRYGFFGKIYSMQEISNILGISHQRVSNIEKLGLKKFKDFLILMGMANENEVYKNNVERKKL